MTDETRWAPVVGMEDSHVVSTTGEVWTVDRTTIRNGALVRLKPRRLKAEPGPRGHLRVTMNHGGRIVRDGVHRIVLAAFVGPCPPGMEGCHADGDPSNNRLENLRWDTHLANGADMVLHGRTKADDAHCARGHEFTPKNTGSDHGRRYCRTCNRQAQRNRYSLKRVP